MKLLIRILIVVSAFINSIAFAAASEWQLKKNDEGISVYTKKVEGSPYKAVKPEVIAEDMRLSALAALIMNAEACPRNS